MSYEFKTEDVFSFAAVKGYSTRERGSELWFTYCPYCNGGKHRDKETFSINIKSGAFQCKRSSCGKQGHFVELARDFDYELDFGSTKAYKTLPQKEVRTNNAAIEYLKGRGISKTTAERYKITTQRNNANILVFPFYDENNILTCVKYRKCDFDKTKDKNKEWFETDTKPILFGMAQCKDFERLIITEGQLDSLSVAECGINNAVSVPNGAMGFTWLSNVWDWIKQFKTVVVFGDWENGGMTLLETLIKRLSNKILAVRQQDYLGEKDANDILRKYGKDAIIKAVENAAPIKVSNVVDLSEVQSVDINSLEKIKTNIPSIDKIIGGIIMGQVILLTGKSGHGKSTFMSQLVCEALEQGESVFVYSGELANYHFKRWLDYQLAGRENLVEHLNEYNEKYYTIKQDIISRINSWYKGRAFIYDNSYVDSCNEQESLIVTAEKVIKQYGVKLVCIDNLMTAMDGAAANELYRSQSVFVGELKRLAAKYNIAVILVAHQRKTKGEFSNDDVSGSADVMNKVDVAMNYERAEDNISDSKLSITKNRLFGKYAVKEKAIPLFYSEDTKRICSLGGNEREYGWNRQFGEITSGFSEMLDFESPFDKE